MPHHFKAVEAVNAHKRSTLGLSALVLTALLLAGCAPAPSWPTATPPSVSVDHNETRGGKIAEAWEELRSQRDSSDEDTSPHESPAAPGPTHPRCEAVAWGRFNVDPTIYGSVDVMVGTAADTGVARHATGEVERDAAGEPREYVVAVGDRLDDIAARVCIQSWDLATLNGLERETSVLHPGQHLRLRPEDKR